MSGGCSDRRSTVIPGVTIMASRDGFSIDGRAVGPSAPPLVVAEIGINHEGNEEKARCMIDDAARAGCECVKFQCHIIEDEMIPNDVVPGNATESIWTIMARCALDEAAEIRLKAYVESKGMLYLSTPFSRAAADRLQRLGVAAYKIGSGECNNYPLVRHIASFGKPIIMSTGMNDIASITPSVEILRNARVPFAVLHCVSTSPTPYEQVHLGAITALAEQFPDAVVGLSDHSLGIYTCLAAVALGASVLEKHFTSDRSWPGPDIPISLDPEALKELVQGSRAVWHALGGKKDIQAAEAPTIAFAYASVVAIQPIKRGDLFTRDNLWVKRPGTGRFLAKDYDMLLGHRAARNVSMNAQLEDDDVLWPESPSNRHAR